MKVMRWVIIGAALFLNEPSVLAQEQAAAIRDMVARQTLQRNHTLERKVFDRTGRISARLQPKTRKALDQTAQKLLERLVSTPQKRDLYADAQQEIHKNFPRISRDQADLLTLYLLGEVAKVLADPDKLRERLDGMNELSEMTSLRLQMTMDRRSKFIATLSQIMKKIATTQDTLVQNIK